MIWVKAKGGSWFKGKGLSSGVGANPRGCPKKNEVGATPRGCPGKNGVALGKAFFNRNYSAALIQESQQILAE